MNIIINFNIDKCLIKGIRLIAPLNAIILNDTHLNLCYTRSLSCSVFSLICEDASHFLFSVNTVFLRIRLVL